jgi:hypothetical protein
MNPTQFDSAVNLIVEIVAKGQIFSRYRELIGCLPAILAYVIELCFTTSDAAVTAVEGKLHDLADSLHMVQVRLQMHETRCKDAGTDSMDTTPKTPGAVGMDPMAIMALIQMILPMVGQLLQWIHDRRHPAPAPTPGPTATV